MFGLCPSMMDLLELEKSAERFRDTVKQAPVAITILRGRDFVPEMANTAYLELVDRKESDFVGRPLFDSLPEVRSVVEPLLLQVLDTGIPFYANGLEVTINRFGKKENGFFNLTYSPLRESDGTISGIIVVANEVTFIVQSQRAVEQSEVQFRNLVMQSPIAMTIFRGPDYVIDIANETLCNTIWHRKLEDVVGKKLLDIFPELNDQKFPLLLKKVLETGIPYRELEAAAVINAPDGTSGTYYLDFEYAPLKDPQGNTSSIMVTVNDVTEKVRSRQQLQDSAERLLLATEGTLMATWDLNLQTREIIHSRRLATIFGFTEEKILTHPEMRSMIHPDDHGTRVEPAFEVALRDGFYFYEARVVHPDQTIRWIRTRGKVIFSDDHTPLRMVGTMIDITDQKLSERKLIESEERLKIVIEASELGTYELDMISDQVQYSDRYLEIFGHPKGSVVAHDVLVKQIHPDFLEARKKAFETAISTSILRYEAAIHWPDGSKHWIEAQGKVSYHANGNPEKLIGTCRDVTEKREAQAELEENEEKFRTLANSMPQFIWTGDSKGVLNYFNLAVYRYSGLSEDEVAKNGWLQIVHPDEQEENITRWVHSVSTGESFQFEHRFRRHDGEYRWQMSRAIPQYDTNGNIVMWVGTSTDIHDKKMFMDELETVVTKRTEELKVSNEELRKSNGELEQFVYVASHDLQEPLRKIQTFVTRILEVEHEHLSDKGKDYLSRTQGASKRMQQLIIDLLAFSRATTDEQHFVLTDMNLLLEKVKDHLSDLIDRNKVSLQYGILPDLNVIPFQFEQLFSNIISNAIKFARQGVPSHIEIAAGTSPGNKINHPAAQPGTLYNWISIADNGIGFDPQFAERIFQVFQRLHGKDAYEGTGIGLAICKKIAENHRGFIQANSAQGSGAVFTIYVPA